MENENTGNYNHDLYKHVEEKDADAISWAYVNSETLVKFPFQFYELQPDEIRANVLYCGICYSDLLLAKGKWGYVMYPLVTGHEIIAEISAIGSDVKDYQIGEKVAFGCMRDCCDSCDFCLKGKETLCTGSYDKFTYNIHWGGYSTQIQQPAKFFFKLPEGLNYKIAAPLLCAGITTYTPIKNHLRKNDKTAVIGIGGLGHLAIQFLSKLGHEVFAFSSSENKKELILSLGAKEVIDIKNQKKIESLSGQFDFIINTLPSTDNVFNLIMLCAPDSKWIQLGWPVEGSQFNIPITYMLENEITLITSKIGNREDTKEMLEYCAKNNIYPMVETFEFNEVPKAIEHMESGNSIFRSVINVENFSKSNNFFK
jgi:uncharacterized zinc-type alcohol dehydrogenase-like protein